MASRNLFIALFLSTLGASLVQAAAQNFENNGNWEAFKRNRSIFGLTASKSPMKEVFSALGNAELSQPKDKHDRPARLPQSQFPINRLV